MPKRTLPAAAPGLPSAKARRAVEATITRLVDLLDRLDPDPTLGWAAEWDGAQYEELYAVDPAAALDAEHDDAEHERDDSDDEPSLGAPNNVDQADWAQGSSDEREWTDPDDDAPTYGGGHSRADRAVFAAVEAQVAALAARLVPPRHLRPRHRDGMVVTDANGVLYHINTRALARGLVALPPGVDLPAPSSTYP